MSESLFENRTIDEMAITYSAYVPGGKLFDAKNKPSKNLHLFLKGIAEEGVRVNSLVDTYNAEFYPDETTDFLNEWEQALGIPDDCFVVVGTSDVDRRRNILVKLAGLNVQTSADFEATAALFGISATVVGGKDASVSPVITPDRRARNTVVVRFTSPDVFPYTFPIVFGSDEITILQCVFEKAIPANCDLRFDAI